MSDTRKRTSREERLYMLEARARGETLLTISRAVGFSQATVRRVLQRSSREDDFPTYARNGAEANPCGTNAAYWRHKRRGERPCVECYAGHAADTAQAKARSRRV